MSRRRGSSALTLVLLLAGSAIAEDPPARLKPQDDWATLRGQPQVPEQSSTILDRHGRPEDLRGLTWDEYRALRKERTAPSFKEEQERRRKLYYEEQYKSGKMGRQGYIRRVHPEKWCEFGPEPIPEGVHPIRMREIERAISEAHDYPHLKWKILKSAADLSWDHPAVRELGIAMGERSDLIDWKLLIPPEEPVDYEAKYADEPPDARGFTRGAYATNPVIHIVAPENAECLQQKRKEVAK